MRFFVENVFESTDSRFSSFLERIQEYHDETGLAICFSIRLKSSLPCHEEPSGLRTLEEKLLPHHLDLVRQYLPITTLQTARDAYIRSRYDKYKLQVAFVENAVEQVRDYDPFFLTMDDIHQSDMLLTGLISKKLFYEEKIMDLRRKKNELQPVRDFFAQCH